MPRGVVHEGPFMRNVLIIGGGAAGMSAASTLARHGTHCTIIEKGPCIGGTSLDLACKGRVQCVKCDVCLSTDKVDPLLQDPMVSVVTEARLDMLERDHGVYRATIALGPRYIDDSKCDGCGRCAQVCPSRAILRKATRQGFVHRIDPDACQEKDAGCTLCSDACPAGSIDLGQEEGQWSVEADAIVVAVGFETYDPRRESRLGHGWVPGVITSGSLESEINRIGTVLVPGTHEAPKRVAFIQCVGSRDPHLGLQLCSKVCCKYSLKLGKFLVSSDKDVKLTYLFMDWRPYDRQDDLLAWAQANKNVRAVRSRPAEIVPSSDGRPMVRYAAPGDGQVIEEEFDMVVLSVGMVPSPSNALVAETMGVKLNQHGYFFAEGKQARAWESKGLVFAGACTGPKDIEECSMEGAVAAGKVIRYLEGLQ
jgi:heterodisulfide reductase subunit A